MKSKMFEYCRSCQEAAIRNTPCYSPCLTSTYTSTISRRNISKTYKIDPCILFAKNMTGTEGIHASTHDQKFQKCSFLGLPVHINYFSPKYDSNIYEHQSLFAYNITCLFHLHLHYFLQDYISNIKIVLLDSFCQKRDSLPCTGCQKKLPF